MSRCRARLTISVCALLLATWASAQVTRQGPGYLFRLHLTKGENLVFSVPFAISGVGEKPLKLQFAMYLHVVGIDRDGLATVHVKMNTGQIVLPGVDPAGGSFVVDQRGRIMETGTSPLGFCVVFPRDPIRIGATFVAPIPSALAGNAKGEGNAQATFRLAGIVGSGRHRQARLTFRVSSTHTPGGTILVRMADGVIDKYYTSFTAIPATTGTAVHVTATIIRK